MGALHPHRCIATSSTRARKLRLVKTSGLPPRGLQESPEFPQNLRIVFFHLPHVLLLDKQNDIRFRNQLGVIRFDNQRLRVPLFLRQSGRKIHTPVAHELVEDSENFATIAGVGNSCGVANGQNILVADEGATWLMLRDAFFSICR